MFFVSRADPRSRQESFAKRERVKFLMSAKDVLLLKKYLINHRVSFTPRDSVLGRSV